MRRSLLRIFGLATFTFVGIGSVLLLGDDAPAKRKPWTTSKIVGSPEPPPRFKLPVPFPNLKFDHPLLLTPQPGGSRLFVAEQGGKIFSFENKPDAKAELFLDVKAVAKPKQTKDATHFENAYGFVFDPNFATNRFCYVCYTVRQDGKPNLADGSRVSRFTVKADTPPTVDAASEEIVFTFPQGGHNGGDLHFGPDGYLYVSSGDAADPNPPDKFKTGQDISDLLASIHRIDVHHKDAGKNYAIPKDNPFVGQTHNGKASRGEVWAYGFRNPWRFSFDRATGDLWAGDVGWEAWEMVHKVERGGNYGWSVVEARQAVNTTEKLGPTPIRPPVIELSHTIAASVTGGYVYRGKKFPELVGKYVFGDWMTRRIWAATITGTELVSLDELTAPQVRIIAFGEDNDGELYLLDYDTGRVHAFAKNDAASIDPTKFPRTLSQSGLYRDAKANQPAEGVYPFEVNAHQWQDYATTEYLLALPGNSTATDYDNRKAVGNDVDWNKIHMHLPKDGVLVKTLSLEMERGNPASRKRVETQILHFDGDAIQGYTYAWRDDQTDADLVPADGAEKSFRVKDPIFGGVRPQTWTFASRVQCGQCHNAWAGYTLGFNREQLNRDRPDGTNQLTFLGEFGLLNRVDKAEKPLPSFTAADVKKLKKYADPADEKQSLNDRARSYLNANCGSCHIFGGGGSVEFHINFNADVKNTNLWDAKPTRGGFEIPDARILAPGDPERSVMYYRMSKFGSGRMPHLGSDFPDETGLKLVRDWIVSLKPGREPAAANIPTEPTKLAERLKQSDDALRIARAVGRGTLSPDESNRVRTAATQPLCGSFATDLLGGYFPDPNKPPTLGSNPRPRAILSLTGDAANGAKLFAVTRSQCVNCHKIDGKGQDVGPDLSQIAKTRTREQLLESILDPSRRIEPQFQSYLLRTLDGRSITGLVVKRDAKEVVLKDAQNKLTTVAADDVESLDASRTSIMPEGLLKDFTPQEAADVLAYLAGRK
ncbi:PQQ-dependent sugar dehydrogenase [Limnoglobus roseus]|uniref:Putative glucose/L-sorbosone dehydrogenase, distantly related to bacterial beta-galactosidase n=1 Tax=Limnoglobus roseus TaxID=2598579 RepID=A0A5C1AAU5_9BACT|nr:PQQ-dependent sugar dehydrogenase [Limnoglobus roseus]QEL14244.1 putative glucose/L-sorbosone dehydrogenase, distantly related to bacterial beta-galactosidase [Limnoglobus roseus]